MNKYFEVKALNSKIELVTLFGSFDRQDCIDEIECEKSNWKAEGFKKIKTVSLLEQIEKIIENEKSLTIANTCLLHDLALKNGLNTRYDLDGNTLHIINIENNELISFYDGFTRLVCEY